FDHDLDHSSSIDRAGGHQGGVLADRVAGGRRGLDAAPPEEERQPDAHEAERGLRVLRSSQLVLAGGGQQVSEVDAGRLRAALAEHGNFLVLEKLGPHARLLGALAGIEKCNSGRHYMPLRRFAPPPHWRGEDPPATARWRGEDPPAPGGATSPQAWVGVFIPLLSPLRGPRRSRSCGRSRAGASGACSWGTAESGPARARGESGGGPSS